VRYVITLDADTRLPRDTVRRLIGKMAHPLNRPRFDTISGRVTEGYAVMQPRVTPSLPVGREGSLFQRIFSSMNGIDPYASTISDVYQDLFGEGSYAGKGIYDVDAFESALANRVPDSTLLSHDLFEGVFARAGLASDVEVVEEFPARYDVAASRHHRWARGDWQLLPWILGRGPSAGKDRKRSAVPAMGRWKMLDNLRRTLSAPSAVLGLLLGWSLPPDAAAIWTAFILTTIMLPALIPVVLALVPGRPGVTFNHSAGASGMVDERRNRAYACSPVLHAPSSAGMDHHSTSRHWSAVQPCRFLSPDGRCRRHRRSGFDCFTGLRPRDVAAGAAFRGTLGGVSGIRLLDQPVAPRRRSVDHVRE
jgi:cyclic beta-1,2-glucan synthetase